MTPKEALELLENRVSTLAINHKIGSRDIANLEIKDIVTCIETHVIPTIVKALNEHEALKKDVARYFELLESNVSYVFLGTQDISDEFDELKEKLSKAGKEE